MAIARGQGDEALEMRTLADAARVDRYHDRQSEGLKKGLRAIELAGRVDDLYAQVAACYEASTDLARLGDLEGARQHAEEVLALAKRLRDRSWLSTALLALVRLCDMQGDWQGSRAFSDRGLAAEPRDPRLLRSRTLLQYEVGDFAQGEAYLERLLEAMRLTSPGPNIPYAILSITIPLAARITGDTGRLEVAEAAAETVLSSPSATPSFAMVARGGLALLAVQRGDVAAAGEQYAALESGRGTTLGASRTPVDRLLGLLSHTMGNLDQAAAHFEDALAFCRKAGYRPDLAWTCCDYADALLQRNNPGDRVKAMSLLDESLAISGELGMRPLMERCLSRREILRA